MKKTKNKFFFENLKFIFLRGSNNNNNLLEHTEKTKNLATKKGIIGRKRRGVI